MKLKKTSSLCLKKVWKSYCFVIVLQQEMNVLETALHCTQQTIFFEKTNKSNSLVYETPMIYMKNLVHFQTGCYQTGILVDII